MYCFVYSVLHVAYLRIIIVKRLYCTCANSRVNGCSAAADVIICCLYNTVSGHMVLLLLKMI